MKLSNIFTIMILSLLLTPFSFAQEEEQPQKMIDFNFAGYEDGGKKKWDVKAQAADIFTKNVKMEHIIGKAYGEEENFQLTAEKGDYNKEVGNIHLEDNVVGTSDSGTTLVTDSLDWDSKQGLVTTDDVVNLKKDNMHTVGTGAVANQNLKTVTLQKDVTVNMAREEEGQMRKTVITCDGPLDIDYNIQVAVFNKNVVATDEQGKMSADKMTVYFDTQTKKIKKVICTGEVKMQQNENLALGEKVTYDAMGKKAQITGRPCLIFYSQKKDNQEGEDAPFGD